MAFNADLPDEEDLLLPPHLLLDGDEKGVGPNGYASSGSNSSGSSSPESDDDDYIVQLAHEMARNMLQEDDYNAAPTVRSENPKLWGFGSCGKPKGSPPAIDDVAGKLENMSLDDKWSAYQKPAHVGSFDSRLLHDRTRAIRFYQLKQEQLMREQGRGCWGRRRVQKAEQMDPNFHNLRNVRDGDRACNGCITGRRAQNHVRRRQPVSGEGMRAVFLGGSGSKGGSCGTGVFLPRGVGNDREWRKKPGCSTALLPARVVQALKLNLDQKGFLSSPSSQTEITHQHGERSLGGHGHGQAEEEHCRGRAAAINRCHHQEMGLPQEWTY
ncbi:uncharacterized protein LOC131148794 isoform X2 [Malania oleifera]|uniref:uncharacterized protein LOC131148794 isoform X2 n=1 Tax=Malania oleifera TaxID=397392 RepID=UPI0025ADEC35|nr:uncharacterized protein LOC131148794 isoform X2 [Malania oleifera]